MIMKAFKNFMITCFVLLTISVMPSQAALKLGAWDPNTTRIIHEVMMGHHTMHSDPAVSPRSKDNFKADFKNAEDVSWRRSEHYDEASFTLDGKNMMAYYNDFGKLIGTTTVKSFSDIPEDGQEKINNKYSDYTVGSVVLYKRKKKLGYSLSKVYGSRYDYMNNYFVELQKGNDKIVVQVNPIGTVYYFTEMNTASMG